MGAQYVQSNNLQFRNLVSFDHNSAGIETQTIIFNQNPNTNYMSSFYNESIGALVSNSLIVGNSDSTALVSITPAGIKVAWDRGLLIKNVSFYNFPDAGSQAIIPTSIIGRCTVGCGGWTTKFTSLNFQNVKYRVKIWNYLI
jgi:hypothetical protein